MNKLIVILLIALSVISCRKVCASECSNLYPNNTPIVVQGTTELCNSFYVSLYDKTNQKVILVAEHLKHGSIGSVPRNDEFHADDRIGKKPNPSQYHDTGYDKGHMAPAGDASNEQEMYETFAMTNMTPQKPTLNRNSWRMLEEGIRKRFASSKTDMYIINIAIYGNNGQMNGIPIPIGYWKIIISDGTTWYYYADNLDNAKVVQKQPIAINLLLPK